MDEKPSGKGLAGSLEEMVYGPGGPPKTRKSFGEIIGAVLAVALLLAVLFGLVMGCLAMYQAVAG